MPKFKHSYVGKWMSLNENTTATQTKEREKKQGMMRTGRMSLYNTFSKLHGHPWFTTVHETGFFFY